VNSITAFISWYLLLTLLGWLTFPLVYRLFPALADRGFSLARVAGLLIWGYIFWLFTSLGLTQNTPGGILFGLLVLAGLSFSSFFLSHDSKLEDRISEILAWLKSNLRYIFSVELLFLATFAFLAFIRAGNPELDGTERPMELMFINSILRSPSFPPHDSWLSGYAISYYYFGYVLTAMLARLAGIQATIAHNLMTSLIFGLAAIGAYGILYDLLALSKPSNDHRRPSTGLPVLGPLFLLLISNLAGFLEVLHQRGIFPPAFWQWLDVKDLTDPVSQPIGGSWDRLNVLWFTDAHKGIDKLFAVTGQWFNEAIMPDRYLWWWRASRVISDSDLLRHPIELIDEFPFFSFLLGDLHPHVLAIPFNLLAVAVGLNLFLGGWRGEINLFGFRLQISRSGFFFGALILGGLAFLNTWDILAAGVLIVLAYVLFRVRECGWSWARLEDAFILGLPLIICAVLLFLPFYFGFSSQAGGILPNIVNPTRGAQLWVMFGPLFVPIFAFLAYIIWNRKQGANWKPAFISVFALVLLLWGFSWLAGWLANLHDPAFARQYLESQGVASVAELFAAASLRRLSYIGGLLTMLALLIVSIAFLTGKDGPGTENETLPSTVDRPPSTFVFLLITLATLLILAPEFVFLRDQFGSRMNTIFKFYYQAWLLFSLAAAFGVAVLLQNLRGLADWAFRIGLVVLLFMSLTYPVLALSTKTNNFNPLFGWTLDDFARVQRGNPDEAAAIGWLKSAPDGVIVEAVGGSYTGYARISTYTGQSAVLGWPGHESQWRGGGAEQGSRGEDVRMLYTTSNWQTALDILKQYNVRYVYIGGMERSTYHVQEDKFKQHLKQVYQSGDVTIYEVP